MPTATVGRPNGTASIGSVIAIAVGASIAALAPSAQPVQSVPLGHGSTPRACAWPPLPQHLVALESAAHPSAEDDTGLFLPHNVSVPIYTVPAGRWLVVTDFVSVAPAHLLEDQGGALSFKWGGDNAHFNPRTGVAFAPGSVVVLRNVTSPVGFKAYYHLAGYLASQDVPDHGWPPPPQNMVVLNSWAQVGSTSGYVSIAGGATTPIYTVPLDRWLVLTDPDVRGSGIELVEVLGSTTTAKSKWGSYAIGHPPSIGLAFAPGSTVALRNIKPATEPVVSFDMTGYLAPQ